MKVSKRKKAVSRNERAENFSSRLHLRAGYSHGLLSRLLLVAVFTIATVLLLPPTHHTQEVQFKAGDIADRDVIAPFNFQVPLSEDELQVARAQAALQALPVYLRKRDVESDLKRDLATLLDTVTAIVNIDTLTRAKRAELVAGWLPSLPANALDAIVRPRALRRLNKAVREYQLALFRRGVIDNASLIRRNGYREITVVDGANEKTRPVADIVQQSRIDQVIREEALARFGSDREGAQVFFELERGHILPNLVFDVDETNSRRSALTSKVPDHFEISKNERIIGKHDKVTHEQERILHALEEARASQRVSRSPAVMLGLYASEVMRLLLFCLLFGAYIYVFHPIIYARLGQLGAVFAVVLLYVVLTAIVVRFDLNAYLAPVALVAVILTALFEFRLGLLSALFCAGLLPLVTPFSPGVMFSSMLAGAAGVAGIEKMRSRSHVYSVFAHIAVAYVLGVMAFGLGAEGGSVVMGRDMLWGVANGLFSAAAVVFLLPVLENLFNRTSRFTLLELTDLNKPLLKRLNMEAHGTYHHSMLIGNLVDAVGDLVGADPLRTRVMAYYHDIGKMFKPEYFAENQNGEFNKHEKITPQMSALILVSHVKDGVELAREEKLPEVVIDGIREHHGTTVMAYFYQKALETDSHSSVNRDDFRYPGPRPRSKETGLLMCADTVEAAVRSLAEPTPTNIRSMVTKLIDARAYDGELDDSGLTLSDLNVIKEKFISILTGIYHKRIAYPGQDENAPAGGDQPGHPQGPTSESVAESV